MSEKHFVALLETQNVLVCLASVSYLETSLASAASQADDVSITKTAKHCRIKS